MNNSREEVRRVFNSLSLENKCTLLVAHSVMLFRYPSTYPDWYVAVHVLDNTYNDIVLVSCNKNGREVGYIELLDYQGFDLLTMQIKIDELV